MKSYKNSYKNPWSIIIEIPYSKNSHDIRDKIERELSKLGEWIGHGSGFGVHDVQIAFKTKKDAEGAEQIAENMMIKYNVNGRILCTHNKSALKKVGK